MTVNEPETIDRTANAPQGGVPKWVWFAGCGGALALVICVAAMVFIFATAESNTSSGATFESQDILPPGLDGQQIAFIAQRPGDFEIYTMNLDGSDLTNLTNHPGFDSYPSWSPDGDQMVFFSDRDGDLEIYLMDSSGGNVTQLTDKVSSDVYPAWSPDGSRIAFITDRYSGQYYIYLMDTDGSNLVRLTASSPYDRPAWSPDGSQIVYTFEREIYRIDINGSQSIALTDGPAAGNRPALSPDGSQIVYHNPDDDRLYIMDINSSDATLLTEFKGADYPSWSPDGEWIAFSLQIDGNFEIHIIRPDGSNLTRITYTDFDNAAAIWRP